VPDEMFASRIFEKADRTLHRDHHPSRFRQNLLPLPGDQLLVQQELVQLGVAKRDVLDQIVDLKEKYQKVKSVLQ
jgi:hypothetical protein